MHDIYVFLRLLFVFFCVGGVFILLMEIKRNILIKKIKGMFDPLLVLYEENGNVLYYYNKDYSLFHNYQKDVSLVITVMPYNLEIVVVNTITRKTKSFSYKELSAYLMNKDFSLWKFK